MPSLASLTWPRTRIVQSTHRSKTHISKSALPDRTPNAHGVTTNTSDAHFSRYPGPIVMEGKLYNVVHGEISIFFTSTHSSHRIKQRRYFGRRQLHSKLRLPLGLLSETGYLHAPTYTDVKSDHFHIAPSVDPTPSQLHIFFYPAPLPEESGSQYLPAWTFHRGPHPCDMCEDWRLPFILGSFRKLWDIRTLAIIWSIWIERNSCIFQHMRLSAKEVSHRVFFFAELWGEHLLPLWLVSFLFSLIHFCLFFPSPHLLGEGHISLL